AHARSRRQRRLNRDPLWAGLQLGCERLQVALSAGHLALELPFGGRLADDGDITVDGGWQHEATNVVDVLAYQIDAPGSSAGPARRAAEALLVTCLRVSEYAVQLDAAGLRSPPPGRPL